MVASIFVKLAILRELLLLICRIVWDVSEVFDLLSDAQAAPYTTLLPF